MAHDRERTEETRAAASDFPRGRVLPFAAATLDQSRRRPPFAAEILDADWPPAQVFAPRPDVTCGASDKDFQSYRNVVMYVWARNGGQKQSSMEHSRFGEFRIHILIICEPNHDLLNHA